MNWIKVEPIIYEVEGDQAVALGGRVEGDDGWLWAINAGENFWRDGEGYLVTDQEYRVTHWAEIEWP